MVVSGLKDLIFIDGNNLERKIKLFRTKKKLFQVILAMFRRLQPCYFYRSDKLLPLSLFLQWLSDVNLIRRLKWLHYLLS